MASLWILALVIYAASGSIRANRIVGGSATTVEQYPSVVQVDSFDPVLTQSWTQTCAASILTSRFVLSAAHCFSGRFYEPRYRRVRAGATYRNFGGELNYVEYSFNHPTFGTKGNDGDICVVKLQTPLVYSPVVQRTAIPPQDAHVPDNFPVTKVGWGYTKQNGSSSELLREVVVYTINNEICADRYATLPSPVPVTGNMICAGLLDIGGRDACYGDSGGPVFFTNITIAVISWGEGCANDTFPGVNTAVSSYTDWIVSHVI